MLTTIALATIVTSAGLCPLPEGVGMATSAVTTTAIRQFEQSLSSSLLAGSSVTHGVRQITSAGGDVEVSIADLFDLVIADVPKEEWEKLPKDLSINCHHHLYG